MSRPQKHFAYAIKTKRSERKVPNFIRGIKALPEQIAANSEMAGPQCEKFRKDPIGDAPTPFQILLFNEIKSKLAEFQSIFMIAEVRARDHAKPYVSEARTVSVAMLKAEIHDPTGYQPKEIHVGVQRRRQGLGQNLKSRQGYRIAHQWQLDQIFDRAAPEPCPDLLVFALRLLFCRARRPLDAQPLKIVQTNLDRPIGSIEGHVYIHAQAVDCRLFDSRCSAG